MNLTPVAATLSLLAAALAFAPGAHAASSIQPCPESAIQCCPPANSVYCCSVLACKPVACPAERIGTDEILALIPAEWAFIYTGPHAEVATTSGCEATVCESATSCDGSACSDGTATCCTAGPVMSSTPCACAPLPPPPPLAEPAATTSIPLPSVGVALEPDCSVTVSEAWTCPNGLVDDPIAFDAGPVQVQAMSCFVQCECIPAAAPAAALPQGLLPEVGA